MSDGSVDLLIFRGKIYVISLYDTRYGWIWYQVVYQADLSLRNLCSAVEVGLKSGDVATEPIEHKEPAFLRSIRELLGASDEELRQEGLIYNMDWYSEKLFIEDASWSQDDQRASNSLSFPLGSTSDEIAAVLFKHIEQRLQNSSQ